VGVARNVRWAADQADEVLGITDVDVTAIVAPIPGPERVAWLADRTRLRSARRPY
jgi:hypothetical protein